MLVTTSSRFWRLSPTAKVVPNPGFEAARRFLVGLHNNCLQLQKGLLLSRVKLGHVHLVNSYRTFCILSKPYTLLKVFHFGTMVMYSYLISWLPPLDNWSLILQCQGTEIHRRCPR